MVAQSAVRTYGVNQILRSDFFRKRLILLLICATCSELKSNVSTMILTISPNARLVFKFRLKILKGHFPAEIWVEGEGQNEVSLMTPPPPPICLSALSHTIESIYSPVIICIWFRRSRGRVRGMA